jgi:hypothetical protein
LRSFANQAALEFGNGRDDVEDEPAAVRGGVDSVGQAAEPDAALAQILDGVDQVPNRPAQAVKFPYDEHVTRLQLGQGLLQLGSRRRAAADGLVSEDDIAADYHQGVELRVQVPWSPVLHRA